MASRAALLRYHGDLVPCQILEDSFWHIEPVTDASSFERIVSEEEDATPMSHFMYQTVFGDHRHGEGTIINPRSILRITVEGNEAT